MLPEISRRCRACGASVRAGGRFCQQCGERVEAAPSGGGDDANASANVSANPNAGAAEASKPQAPEEFAGAFRRPSASASAVPATPAPEEVKEVKAAYEEFKRAAPAAPASAPAFERPPASAPVIETPAAAPVVERPAVEDKSPAAATETARGRRAAAVRESLRPRVERVRDASMGVIEEASEDTGLRFVLISVAVFLLFLLLLLLNSLLK